MRLNDAGDDGEAQPAAGDFCAVVCAGASAVEALEDAGLLGLVDPRPRVGYPQPDFSSILRRADFDPIPRRAIL